MKPTHVEQGQDMGQALFTSTTRSVHQQLSHQQLMRSVKEGCHQSLTITSHPYCNRSWKFQWYWNVPLVLLERSWWAGFNGIYLVKLGFRMWEILILKWFLLLNIQKNSKKPGFERKNQLRMWYPLKAYHSIQAWFPFISGCSKNWYIHCNTTVTCWVSLFCNGFTLGPTTQVTLVYIKRLNLWTNHVGQNWFLTCNKIAHVKSGRCVVRMKCKTPLLWKPLILTLFNKINKLDDSKAYWSLDEQQIIFRLHSSDHDVIIFRYTKCSFVGMFILLKDESNILIFSFWHWNSSLKVVLNFPKCEYFLSFLNK